MSGSIEQRFGLRVRDLRRQGGMSQEELAFRAHLHRTYICEIEGGKRNASLRAIAQIAAGLGVELNLLFTGVDFLADEFSSPTMVPTREPTRRPD